MKGYFEVGQVWQLPSEGDNATLTITRVIAWVDGSAMVYWRRENGYKGNSLPDKLYRDLKHGEAQLVKDREG